MLENVRVSDADRQRVIEQLHEHTTAGRLTLDEFEERIAEAETARTAAELERTLRELPTGLGLTAAEIEAARARYRRAVRDKFAGWASVNLICTGIWLAGPDGVPFWPIWPLIFTTVGLLGLLIRGADAQVEELEKERQKAAQKEARRAEKLSGSSAVAAGPADRVLATVLYVDVVDSTRLAAELGDRGWGEVLDEFEDIVRTEIHATGGELVKTAGDSCLATFSRPADAVRTGLAIRDRVGNIDLAIRGGVHTGELQLRGDDIAGIAVHIGQRVCALARPGEVLVSRTVVDLVAGSGIAFSDRGAAELKGVPGEWQLFAAGE